MQYHVRNMLDTPDTITLELDVNSYPLAEFVDAEGLILEDDRRVSVQLQPDEQRTFYIRIFSSEPDTEFLWINATSATDPGLFDSDQLFITITFPVAFPGLDEFASLFIVTLSLPVYFVIKKRKWFA